MPPSPLVSETQPSVRLFARPDKKQIAVFLKNGGDTPFRGTVRYFVERTDGVTHGDLCDEVHVPAQSETQLIFFDRREIREKRALLRMLLSDEAGNEICRAFWQSEKMRPRHLHDPKLNVTPFLRAGKVCVSVRAACFAPDIVLRCGEYAFSENNFTLFAGEEKTVELLGAKANLTEAVTAKSAFDRR